MKKQTTTNVFISLSAIIIGCTIFAYACWQIDEILGLMTIGAILVIMGIVIVE
jgi:hypothetical protein